MNKNFFFKNHSPNNNNKNNKNNKNNIISLNSYSIKNSSQQQNNQKDQQSNIINYRNFNDRVDYYLGIKFFNKKDATDMINIDSLDMNSKKKTIITECYNKPFYNLLKKTNNLNKRFKIIAGDNNLKGDTVTIAKNRFNNNNSIVILRCLNLSRHWDLYYNKPDDIKFSSKINKIFWRGITTGKEFHKPNRFELVLKWFNKNKNIDIGFSNICHNKEKYRKYVKGEEKPSTFLKYKYILSVNGNDKDSGLQWKLNSNSVVLMCKPNIISWLMESRLIPNYHYVLLKDDFSDLEEKLHWCNNNQDRCLQIVKNANLFMKQFSNDKVEEEIEVAVINKYFKLLDQ